MKTTSPIKVMSDDQQLEDIRLADLLALNVVSEVIEEAYVIANAALESESPLAYLEMIKNLRNDVKLDQTLVEDINLESKPSIDCNVNIVATSTPQKHSTKLLNPQIDSTYIGQGDESAYLKQDDIGNCTTNLINHLFDMSEVERVINDAPDYSIQECLQPEQDPNDMLQQALTKIANAFMNDTLIPIPEDYINTNELPKVEEIIDEVSDYSFLDDAFPDNYKKLTKDVAFYDHNDTCSNIEGFDNIAAAVEEPISTNIPTIQEVEEPNDLAYENAFLSLNRDYEQATQVCYPEIEDPKYMTLQEVQLSPTSDIDLTTQTKNDKEELDSESIVFAAASGSRKSLARRCRMQGARILACLRGWWRRKAHGRRKECRGSGSVRGMYPIAPGLRSRTSSLIEERKLGSPSVTKRSARKFNTISEAVVKSCFWKDYKFDIKPKF